ncbi:ycf20-like protein isoform X2 [Capsicum chacoense]
MLLLLFHTVFCLEPGSIGNSLSTSLEVVVCTTYTLPSPDPTLWEYTGFVVVVVSSNSFCLLLLYALQFMAYRMNAIMLPSLAAAAENESLGQLFVVSRSSPILYFSNNSLEATEQIPKIGLKCMPSPNIIRSRTRRRGSRIAFALDTGRIPSSSSDDQDGLNGDGRDLGGTRLGRIVGAGARQLLEKLNSARKNFPMKVFLLLLGFYTANALATILGQTGDWDVLVAGVVVAAIEGIGMLVYKKPPSLPSRRFESLVSMVNYWKAGVILGLFVDAFKLGS